VGEQLMTNIIVKRIIKLIDAGVINLSGKIQHKTNKIFIAQMLATHLFSDAPVVGSPFYNNSKLKEFVLTGKLDKEIE